MISLPPAERCRLSGEPLNKAEVLFELPECPLPGIYPSDAAEAEKLRSPLRVVQAPGSRLVQLGHVFDASLYTQYAFAGGVAGAYRRHLEWFADKIARRFSPEASVLEVGCGDGWLLRRLRERGYGDVLGIDPSRAASQQASDWLLSGYFPDDLPAVERDRRRDLVVCRHVLEHIENPLPFMRALAGSLKPDGEVWIEVPDLDSTVDREIWSNFYQLHCSYFSAASLDHLAAAAGLRCIGGTVVEVFGGSLLRRYVLGEPSKLPPPLLLAGLGEKIRNYRERLDQLAHRLPSRAVGYGAAERTAVVMGFAPRFRETLACLHDGNPLLEDRYLAGTSLVIRSKEALFAQPPPAIVLFAISNVTEILQEWKSRLNGSVMVGIAGGDFAFKELAAFS